MFKLDDCGDQLVIINSNEIALRGDEWKKRVYFHHTGYPRGASWTLAWELHQKDPTMVFIYLILISFEWIFIIFHFCSQILKKAIYSSITSNLTRRTCMERLHIYPGSEIPENIKSNINGQIRPLRPVPKPLQQYSQQEIDLFPKIFDYPKDYIVR